LAFLLERWRALEPVSAPLFSVFDTLELTAAQLESLKRAGVDLAHCPRAAAGVLFAQKRILENASQEFQTQKQRLLARRPGQ
jgi:hypothetical protein